MKKYLFIAIAVAFAGVVYAQNDSMQKPSHTYHPLIHLTKSQIQRYPAADFMELVYQAFSFVSGDPVRSRDFTFVVDGNVTIDPDAISIDQIESITFYPGGTQLSRTSLTRNGTFIISTKRKEQNYLSLSTKTGVELGNDDYPFPTRIYPDRKAESDPSVFTLDEAVYATNAGKFSLNSSFSFLRRGNPSSQSIKGSDTVFLDQKIMRYRVSNFLGYSFNESWKLNAGLFYTHQDSDDDIGQVYYSPSTYLFEFANESRTNYYGATLGLSSILSKEISNEFSAEGNQTRGKVAGAGIQYSAGYILYQMANETRIENYSFYNQTQWNHHLSPAFDIQGSLNTRYRINKNSNNSVAQQSDINGQPVSSSAQMNTVDSKGFSATPELTLFLKKFLVVSGGVSFDNYQTSIFNQNDPKWKFYPVAGLRFDAAPFFKTGVINELYVTSDYCRYIKTHEETSNTFIRGVVIGGPMVSGTVGTPDMVSTRWLSTLGTSILDKRFGLKLNYLDEKFQSLFIDFITGGGGSTFVYTYAPVEKKGWGAELSTAIIQKEKYKWNLRSVLFRENYTTKENFSSPPVYPADQTHVLNPEQPQWSGNIYSEAEAGQFFLQANALLNFNKKIITSFAGNYDYVSDHRFSFLLIGYRLKLKKSELKNVEFNLQAKNLNNGKNSTNTTMRFRYVGIGGRVEL